MQKKYQSSLCIALEVSYGNRFFVLNVFYTTIWFSCNSIQSISQDSQPLWIIGWLTLLIVDVIHRSSFAKVCKEVLDIWYFTNLHVNKSASDLTENMMSKYCGPYFPVQEVGPKLFKWASTSDLLREKVFHAAWEPFAGIHELLAENECSKYGDNHLPQLIPYSN